MLSKCVLTNVTLVVLLLPSSSDLLFCCLYLFSHYWKQSWVGIFKILARGMFVNGCTQLTAIAFQAWYVSEEKDIG